MGGIKVGIFRRARAKASCCAGLPLAGWIELRPVPGNRKKQGKSTVRRPSGSKQKENHRFEVSGSQSIVKAMILRGQHTRHVYRIPPVSESLKDGMKTNGSEIDRSIRKPCDSADHPPTTTDTTGWWNPGGLRPRFVYSLEDPGDCTSAISRFPGGGSNVQLLHRLGPTSTL